ncbi:diacylglycerol kinase family protein [Gemella sp. zg-1178]|uniref:diacylglycerol/lipid kinase family protein n=1 Tax=Gemella sp. zg-1178 TaxID=2840372 RepID=UPI001C05509B|nr:diacylglycerol kinase family protein [Gemella sp. zg-1178]MBU0278758.1 hypothetical protein [Gemella sp. zg-1178]
MNSISILVYLNAGGEHGKSSVARLQATCNQRNIDFKVYTTKYPKHTKILIQEIALKNKYKENHRIVVVGGDGTLNEAMYGLHSLKEKIPISYFPSGTGNDFARSLKLTADAEKFIDNIFKVDLENLEFIEVSNERGLAYVAMNGMGIGFDALISHLTNQDKKKNILNRAKMGKMIYISKILAAFRNRSVFDAEISVDNKEVYKHKNILFASFMKNQYFGGGIKIIPDAHKNSGLIYLALAKYISAKDILRLLPHVLKTGKHFEKTPKFTKIIGKEFTINVSGENYLQADGETDKIKDTKFNIKLATYPFYLVEE